MQYAFLGRQSSGLDWLAPGHMLCGISLQTSKGTFFGQYAYVCKIVMDDRLATVEASPGGCLCTSSKSANCLSHCMYMLQILGHDFPSSVPISGIECSISNAMQLLKVPGPQSEYDLLGLYHGMQLSCLSLLDVNPLQRSPAHQDVLG